MDLIGIFLLRILGKFLGFFLVGVGLVFNSWGELMGRIFFEWVIWFGFFGGFYFFGLSG